MSTKWKTYINFFFLKKKAREIDLNRFDQGFFVSIVFLSLENLKIE